MLEKPSVLASSTYSISSPIASPPTSTAPSPLPASVSTPPFSAPLSTPQPQVLPTQAQQPDLQWSLFPLINKEFEDGRWLHDVIWEDIGVQKTPARILDLNDKYPSSEKTMPFFPLFLNIFFIRFSFPRHSYFLPISSSISSFSSMTHEVYAY
jgi:hypothetical protein